MMDFLIKVFLISAACGAGAFIGWYVAKSIIELADAFLANFLTKLFSRKAK